MKKSMTRLTAFFAAVMAICACCILAACADKKEVKPVVITADDTAFSYEDKTLIDYMEYLRDGGELTYTVSGGMVTEINGTSNTANSYWMLYTSDTENANNDWGTYEYEGTVYGSASFGAESLALKQGCTYIWAYQTF